MPEIKTILSAVDESAAAFASMQARAKATTESISGAFDGLRSSIETAFVGVSIAGIADFVLGTAEAAEHLDKLAIKAGIGADAMAQFGYVARMSDVDLDTLSQGIAKMQRSIAQAEESGGKAARAFTGIGISISELRSSSPQKQFELIADAISRIQDPARQAEAAMAIFGRGGAGLLPVLKEGAEGISRLREEYKGFAGALTDESIHALTTLSENWKTLKASASALADTLESRLAPSLALTFRTWAAGLSDDPAVKLRNEIERARNADAFGSMSDASLGSQLARLEKEYQDKFGQKDVDAFNRGLPKEYAGQDFYAKPDEVITTAKAWGIDDDLPGFDLKAIKAQEIKETAMEKFYDSLQKGTQTEGEKSQEAFDKFKAELEALNLSKDEYNKRMVDYLARQTDLQDIKVTGKKEKYKNPYEDDEMRAGKQMAQAMENDFAQFFIDPSAKGLKQMVANFGRQMESEIARLAAEDLMSKLFPKGAADSFTKFFQSLGFGTAAASAPTGADAAWVPVYADGGDPPQNEPSLVGERGPELFIPKTAGTIIPNDKIRGETHVTQNIVQNVSGLGLTYEQVQALMARNNRDMVEALINPRYRNA